MQNNKWNIVWLVQDHVTWKHYKDTAGPKPTLATYDRIGEMKPFQIFGIFRRAVWIPVTGEGEALEA